MQNIIENFTGDDDETDEETRQPQYVRERLKHKAEIQAMLQSCWVPALMPGFIHFVTESSSCIMCFYTGAFVLTYEEIMNNGFCDFLVVLSILLGLFVTSPALLLRKTLLQCLTHADHKLIGEVNDYMEENKKMRKVLIDALFPHMDSHLMDHISGKDILRIFEHFDDDMSYTIAKDEFVKGCETLGMHLSTHRIRRLLRMLDNDRSGTIDPEEIFVLLCEEKLTRIMDRVKMFFYRFSEPEGSDLLPAAQLTELMIRTYGKDVKIPQEAMDDAKKSLVNTMDIIEMKAFRAWIIKRIELDKDDVHKELEVLKESGAAVPTHHKWYDPRGYLHRNAVDERDGINDTLADTPKMG